MPQEHMDIIKAALKGLRKNEDFEQAVGREVRKRALSFETYLSLMAEVRELSRREKVSNERAARMLLQQHVDDP